MKMNWLKYAISLCGVAACLTSCDNVIYDDEGNCSYHVRFRYDYNMKWADAFPAEVTGVTLYAIDQQGKIAYSAKASGDALQSEGFQMDISSSDLQPGTYTLVAWGGDEEIGSYPKPSGTAWSDLHVELERDIDSDGTHHHRTQMDRLYYGVIANCEFSKSYGDTFTVPMMKDTNDIRVVLQHLNGDVVAKDEFDFFITDANGALDHNNAISSDTELTYHPWLVRAGSTSLGEVSDGLTNFSAAVAEFTTCRLMADHSSSALLNIVKAEDGETVVKIPLIEALLLVKGYYRDESRGSQDNPLGDQEYLDRQDDYSLTFFLDENCHWISSVIYINSWRIVLQNTEL